MKLASLRIVISNRNILWRGGIFMDRDIRHLFHKGTINEEMGIEFEDIAEAASKARENSSGKEYRDALKEVYRETEDKRNK